MQYGPEAELRNPRSMRLHESILAHVAHGMVRQDSRHAPESSFLEVFQILTTLSGYEILVSNAAIDGT